MNLTETDYEKSLNQALSNYYTQEQIDEFSWNVNKENSESYRFDFTDHKNRRQHLVYWKETDHVQLYRA